MITASIIVWEDRLTRLALVLLALATAYGIAAGAVVAMYYDLTPNMGALEDNLGAPLLGLYLLASLASLAHLPLAAGDVINRSWKQAALRALVALGPFVVFIGADGLVAHFLWWSPISDTDQFHLLHHSVFAGAPLTFSYWLAVKWWWRPTDLNVSPSLSLRTWLISGIMFIWVVLAMGILTGLVPLPIFGGAIISGLLAAPVIWWKTKKPVRNNDL